MLQMACDEHNIEPENRSRSIDILSRHIDDALMHQREFGSRNKILYIWTCVKIGKFYGAFVCLLYVIVKLLYVGNVFGQFFLLNRFLETDEYPLFGAHVLWDMLNGREWQNSGKFPRVTLCDFEIRVLGNIHRHTVQCVLVINMFTEKIFVFLWLWFLLLFFINACSFIYWLFMISVPQLRIGFVYRHLELTELPPESDKYLRRFVINFLRPDGVFVLRMLASHAGTVMCNEIIYALWLRFRGMRGMRMINRGQKTGSQISIPSISTGGGGMKIKSDKETNTNGPLYKPGAGSGPPGPSLTPMIAGIPTAPRYEDLAPPPMPVTALANTKSLMRTSPSQTPPVSSKPTDFTSGKSNPLSVLYKPSKLLVSKLSSAGKDTGTGDAAIQIISEKPLGESQDSATSSSKP